MYATAVYWTQLYMIFFMLINSASLSATVTYCMIIYTFDNMYNIVSVNCVYIQ